MDICVCIGSSCHVKGSYGVKVRLEELVEQYRLQNNVKIKAAFCLGNCKDDVTIKIGEKIITGVSKDNIDEIFHTYVINSGIDK